MGEEATETPKKKDPLNGRKNVTHLKEKGRKGAKSLTPGTIEPRNNIEALFLATFGTITPIPEATMRRGPAAMTAALQYIHHNRTIREMAEVVGSSENWLSEIKCNDRWDAFKQELQQLARPSSLALIEHHDLDRINEERDRRLLAVPQLIEAENKIVQAIPNMVPGSLMQSTALGNLVTIRKIIAATIGMDAHLTEQHSARKGALTKMATNFIGADAVAPESDKGSILDV